jgi:6-phosphofructokinase 2
MQQIVTITFSPCIDKSTIVPALIPEKKLYCSAPKLEPGGGGINVARAVKKLGGEAIAIFPSGGYTGKYFDHLLEKENIPSVIIETANETRENIIVFEKCSSRQFRFGMPGTQLSETEWKACLSAVAEVDDAAFIVASGSLPPGVPADIYAQLAKIAKKRNAKFVADTSGEALRYAMNEGAFLLKPNLNELAFLAGEKEISVRDAKDIATTLLAKSKTKMIVVSMGAAGAILVTEDLSMHINAPAVIPKSTVGAGDSMVAGILFYLSQQKDITEAVQYGVACGAAATLHPGTELCTKESADRLYSMIHSVVYQFKAK